MVLRLVPLVLPVLLAMPPAARPATAGSQADNPQQRSEQVAKGASHFDRAFYELTPRGRAAEAAREFDLAIGEFEAELRARATSLEAHRYLARIFTLQKQHRKAARHYDEMSALEPGNLDVRVLAALAWAEAGDMARARSRLLAAKARTVDASVLARLDQYLARLDRDDPAPQM